MILNYSIFWQDIIFQSNKFLFLAIPYAYKGINVFMVQYHLGT